MKLKSMLAAGLVAVSASIAGAQNLNATFTVNWKNSVTGGMDPIGPGQSAKIWIDVAFGPAVGTPVQTPQGAGEIAGLTSIFFDLIGTGNPGGSWQTSGSGFGGTPNIDGPFTNTNWNSYGRRTDVFGGWALTNGPPSGQGGGALGGTIHDYMSGWAGQFPLSPPANHFNPVREIWRAAWTPSDYTARMVSFDSVKASAASGTGVALLVLLPNETHTWIDVPAAGINWGSVQIAVVPAPSGMMLLVFGAAGVVRRRRRRHLQAVVTGWHLRPGSSLI